jgi:anti-sigma B factor antagonist
MMNREPVIFSDDLQIGVDDILDDDFDISDSDSGILSTQAANPGLLRITHDGSKMKIGFPGSELLDEFCLSNYRDQIFQSLQELTCDTLQFDLTNLILIPSGMLGLMASVKKRGYNVELVNPSDAIREVLSVTRMDSVFTICESSSS